MAATNTNTPFSSSQKDNESLMNDALIESNSCGDVIKESTFNLQPVAPFTSGDGLPYAPEGCPNPGDIWGWKVGRRTNKAGCYFDRYLFPPRSLLQPSCKRVKLQSKPHVKRYLESNFPNMEHEAFFALFSWEVPSTELSPTKAAQSLSAPPSVKSLETVIDETEEIAIQGKLKRKAQLSNQPTRKSFRLIHVRSHFPPVAQDTNDIIDLSSLNDEESPNVAIAENFDDYLNTLEDILVLPQTETSLSDSVVPAITQENEMAECRKKLSSLLAMDFPSLVSSNNVAEAAKLASRLRKDPSLSVDQLIKLKLVEEMLLLSEAFQEAKGNMEEADKFFADLEAKKLKVPCLKNEYNELKDKVAQIEVEIDTSSLAIQEIDDQILQLQSKRSEMSSALETMHKTKAVLISGQTMIANSIPTIVSEIQHGHSVKRKWELKKAKCAQRIAEIQERFISLRGLTF